MSAYDYALFFSYIFIILTIGLWQRRCDKSEKEFFLAGKSMGYFPIGISIMVTMFSTINFAMFPTEVFSNGLYIVLTCFPVFILVTFPIVKVFIPFFYRMKSASAYEFLEKRFDLKVRSLASLLFILWRILWMATALYASSAVLSQVTSLDLPLLIIMGGSVTIIYTAFGGIRAVMWTDVSQFFVLFGGIITALILVSLKTPGGFSGVFATAYQGGSFRPIAPFDYKFLSFDPQIRVTVWSGLIGAFVAFLARYGADQVVIQRYFTAKTLRKAQLGFIFNIVIVLLVLSLLTLLGMAVYSHSVHGTSSASGAKPPVAYLAALIRSLPWGCCGLMAAGLLAAMMSSMDSGINSCTTIFMNDFYHRFLSHGEQHTKKFFWHHSIISALLIGLLTVLLAQGMYIFFWGNQSLFAIMNKVVNALGSPILALVLLGMFPKRINASAVFWGGITGTIWSICISFGVKTLALHYYAVVNLLGTLALCYMFDFVLKRRHHSKSS